MFLLVISVNHTNTIFKVSLWILLTRKSLAITMHFISTLEITDKKMTRNILNCQDIYPIQIREYEMRWRGLILYWYPLHVNCYLLMDHWEYSRWCKSQETSNNAINEGDYDCNCLNTTCWYTVTVSNLYPSSWNHKRISLYYLTVSVLFGITGTIISLMIRLEIDSSSNRIMSTENINIYLLCITCYVKNLCPAGPMITSFYGIIITPLFIKLLSLCLKSYALMS